MADSRKDWVILTKTQGKFEADLIAGELNAFGIPAWAWQEGAGQALGITVGVLGEGRVLVPPDRLEEAQSFIDELEFEDDPEIFGDEENDSLD